MKDISKDWSNLRNLFEVYTPQHLRFIGPSKIMAQRVCEEVRLLHQKFICDWKRPNIGGDSLKVLTERLQRAQESCIYRWVWRKLCAEEKGLGDISSNLDPNNVIVEWTESAKRSLSNWGNAVRSIQSLQIALFYAIHSHRGSKRDDPGERIVGAPPPRCGQVFAS